MRRLIRLIALVASLTCSAASAAAAVRAPDLVANDMVFQRDKEICVSGQASSGEKVRVSLGSAAAETQADQQGKWSVKLPPMKAVIDGQTVLVSHDRIAEPKSVRFAWCREAVHNLSNKEGLPAYPFRTERGGDAR